MKCILGKKIGMSTIFDKDGNAVGVTLVECAPNTVRLVRTSEKDGYEAVQLEILKTRRKTKKKEFRSDKSNGDGDKEYKKGDTVEVDFFKTGIKVKVSGISKGKGFQGVVKRHGFSGAPHSHGHKHDWRAPGSIGSAFPEHVFKGKKMAGRTGGTRVTVKNIEIIYVDKEKNILALKGAIPGVNGSIVEVIGI